MLSCPFRVLYIQKKTQSAPTKLLAKHISDGLIGLKGIIHVYVCICALNVKKDCNTSLFEVHLLHRIDS